MRYRADLNTSPHFQNFYALLLWILGIHGTHKDEITYSPSPDECVAYFVEGRPIKAGQDAGQETPASPFVSENGEEEEQMSIFDLL